MSKKNKFLAGSLVGLNAVGMAASTSNNAVEAFDLKNFLLNFFGKSEWFRSLFKSLYTGLNEYKYSDIVLDSLGYTGLVKPENEGEAVELEGVKLVAKRIGDENNNILMWRAESKTKPGKGVYICDKQTWEDEIFPQSLDKDEPEYVSFFMKLLEDKKIQNPEVLKENGFDELCKNFKDKVNKAEELVKVEELLSSKKNEDIQYNEFWDYEGKLGLPRPENIGDKIAIVKSEGLKKLKENEDYLNGKKRSKLSNYPKDEDLYELTALKINGKWCWVNYTIDLEGNIKNLVCFYIGGEKPADDKVPAIELDEDKLLKVLPGFGPYLEKRNEYLKKHHDKLKKENGVFAPLSMTSWLNGGWYKEYGNSNVPEK